MTIINGIEIDVINYIKNDINDGIKNNDPIEDKLNVVIVISNPCKYGTRYKLANEFIKRMEEEKDVNLYIVELAYKTKNKDFYITRENCTNHLRITCDEEPIWHKENMINMAVRHLLPNNWKAFAWVDADIEFENVSWAKDTLKILNGTRDIVQLFSHCLDMDKDENTMSIFSSFGCQYSKNKPYKNSGLDFWHPGYAWAITRQAYEKVGGLYELSILGSGDHNMAQALLNNGFNSINGNCTTQYKDSIKKWEEKAYGLKLGYVPGVIRHFFHGSKKNRKYSERWEILTRNKFDPYVHLTHREDGLLIPSDNCPKELLDDIILYFQERKEDE